MNAFFLLRLAFDLVAAGLLVFGFSYWWLGNTAHELAGAGMFVLLGLHNVFNRRYYGTISRSRRDLRGLVNVVVTMALLLTLVTLLITSVSISHALAGLTSRFGGFNMRQLHTLAAYWALVIVAVHVGLRWPMIMSVTRKLFGISTKSKLRTWLLRLVSALIAAHGVWSSFKLDLGTRLAMQITLDWWNFEEAVTGFFVHCVSIAGLYVVVTYALMTCFERRKPDISASGNGLD